MRRIITTNRYEKSLRKWLSSGMLDESVFVDVLDTIVNGDKMPIRYKDHKLKGKMLGYRECHIHHNILLIYEIRKKGNMVVLYDMGTHAYLLGM